MGTSKGKAGEVGEIGEAGDTLYSITPAQLRATALIFAEHDFLKSENALLQERIALLERSGSAKESLIRSQQAQINTLNEIIIKKDAMLMNSDAMIDILKSQIAAEQKKQKKFWYGAGAGVAVGVTLMAILK